ncbi:phosphoribosylformylglycinamidine cyclo-ligase [Halalkalicoccus salilacus]|uniref:phosphoribosylformylglycinamidine cyclo-ligase n=1 Tax=Halalkalicoccus sp. GCM10025704 TaxID=3252662 RepID=UPI0036218E31
MSAGRGWGPKRLSDGPKRWAFARTARALGHDRGRERRRGRTHLRRGGRRHRRQRGRDRGAGLRGGRGAAAAESEGEYAGLLDIGDRYLGLATDGVGTKLLVAEALSDYSSIGIDCIAMNANDLVAAGVEPVAFVDYLAVEEPDERFAQQIGEGLSAGAAEAGVELVGGETAVMPEVISGLDLAGTCAGLAPKGDVFEGRAEPGDALVGWASSGIHSNGLTLARKAATREGVRRPVPRRRRPDRRRGPPGADADLHRSARTDAVPRRSGAAHVTGGGWTNLERFGERRYVVDDPFPVQPVFEFVQERGNVSDAEMHRTFNMGTGFVAALSEDAAESLATETGGRVIGRVKEGEGVEIRGLSL